MAKIKKKHFNLMIRHLFSLLPLLLPCKQIDNWSLFNNFSQAAGFEDSVTEVTTTFDSDSLQLT